MVLFGYLQINPHFIKLPSSFLGLSVDKEGTLTILISQVGTPEHSDGTRGYALNLPLMLSLTVVLQQVISITDLFGEGRVSTRTTWDLVGTGSRGGILFCWGH